ncbi:MAG: pyruvoyl-dependent arginine decarboxylase [Methanobacteriota archaeon]|nr:MAG: pyruvoyl-dependent arginine decarboxylase [Euryarchaeota archaeon]
MTILTIPKRFFVTSGKAVSKVSDLNAFDKALLDAGIGEQNLVSVSSVLPKGITQVKRVSLPMGAITPCVLAQQRGSEGETISAGIAYVFREDGEGGYVAEGHGHMNRKAMKEILCWKIEEMAKLRNVSLGTIRYRIEELSIPMDHYGVCVAALVFM